LIAIIDVARRGESAVRRVKLVWMMRSRSEYLLPCALVSYCAV
jgi:hypothetical protein